MLMIRKALATISITVAMFTFWLAHCVLFGFGKNDDDDLSGGAPA